MFTRKRVAAVAAVAMVPLLVPSVASAQQGPTNTCSGDPTYYWPGVGFDSPDAVLVSDQPNQGYNAELPLAADIPAGTYDVQAAAYDGGANRVSDLGIEQENEQYYVTFLDAGGVEIARTAITPDLADNVIEAEWIGPVGEVVLDRPATTIVAVHAFPLIQNRPNSVMPTCIGLAAQAPPTTTTSTTTTSVAPPSSTTLPPTTSLAPPSSTTLPPTTSIAPPTSTTLPDDEISQMPPPTPTPATPSFTG